jgi:hypothetical protein
MAGIDPATSGGDAEADADVKASGEEQAAPVPMATAALDAAEAASDPDANRQPVEDELPAPAEVATDLPLSFEEKDLPSLAPAPAIDPVDIVPAAMPSVRPRLLQAPPVAPSVAIVIDDLGYNERAAHRLIAAGRPLTLAFLPISPNVAGQARSAAAAGMDVIVHMPMEPLGRENPGRGAIRVGMPAESIEALVEAGLAAVPGAIGLNNHMGSKVTSDLASMRPVMATLARRGLFFLDSRTSGSSKAHAAALASGVPAIGRDVFLDNEVSFGAVMRQLQATERRARTRGYAVAIGHPHNTTIDALLAWMPEAEARGISLTTLKTLVPLDTCRQPIAQARFDCSQIGVAAVAQAERH